MKKLIFLVLLLFSIHSANSQTTYVIKDVKVNNVAIPNNSPIYFGTNASVVVRFTVQFTKPSNLTIGNVSHVIGTTTNSGFVPLITTEFFTLGVGNVGFSGTWEKTLYAEDYGYSGTNYLVSKFTQTSGTPPLQWESNHVPINRSPVFTLNPSTLYIPCGSTSSQTFTVSNSGTPPGATVTYNWSVGSGWSGTVGNGSSITLWPTSGSVLPSYVYVTPVFNGISQPMKTCAVYRDTFTTTAAITGTTGICSGSANYSINIGSGQTVSWSLSNPAAGTLSNPTNTSVTVNFSSNAAQTLNALITNSCGQTGTKSFQINTGSSTYTSNAVISGSTGACASSGTYTLSNLLPSETVVWYLSNEDIGYLSGTTNTQTTVNIIDSGAQTLTAAIYNLCGQYAIKTVSFYNGAPTLDAFTCGSMSRDFCSGAPIEMESNSLPWLDLNDKVTATFNGMTAAEKTVNANWQWQPLNSYVTLSGSFGQRRIGMINYGVTGVQVRAKNACGWSQWYPLNFEIVEIPQEWDKQSGQPANNYVISPNPSNDVVNIDLRNSSNIMQKSPKFSGELFDLTGISKSKIEIINNQATFSVKGLSKGIYVLKIFINDTVETHRIAVE